MLESLIFACNGQHARNKKIVRATDHHQHHLSLDQAGLSLDRFNVTEDEPEKNKASQKSQIAEKEPFFCLFLS